MLGVAGSEWAAAAGVSAMESNLDHNTQPKSSQNNLLGYSTKTRMAHEIYAWEKKNSVKENTHLMLQLSKRSGSNRSDRHLCL